MTIPWSNLYSDPVIIEVDGFYAVIQPESGLLWLIHTPTTTYLMRYCYFTL